MQLLKGNFGHCARDCLEAIQLDGTNLKAMYRAAKAYYELKKLPEGLRGRGDLFVALILLIFQKALKYCRMASSKAKTAQLAELERDIARAMRKERLKQVLF